MLRKRINKYNLPLREDPSPVEQRKNLTKEVLRDSTFFPKTVEYKDIDEAFKKWVEEDLRIVFEDEVVPTYALYSNQRFSEYAQMWDGVDENRNLKMNFKVVTRDNNPKESSMYAKAGNIPINTKYLMAKKEILNDEGKRCYLEYRVSQPVTVDFSYRIILVTNKYELLNEFNSMIHGKFSSIQAYIFPNDHPMPMKLVNVSDESEYTADDRQYFAQVFEIQLLGYILTKEDFEERLVPIMNVSCLSVEGSQRKADVEIEEIEKDDEVPCWVSEEERYYNQPIKITMSYLTCDSDRREFEMDCRMIVKKIETTNIRQFKLRVNDELIVVGNDGFYLEPGDIVNINIARINKMKDSNIVLFGENPDVVYDKMNDVPESSLDETNFSQEIEIL